MPPAERDAVGAAARAVLLAYEQGAPLAARMRALRDALASEPAASEPCEHWREYVKGRGCVLCEEEAALDAALAPAPGGGEAVHHLIRERDAAMRTGEAAALNAAGARAELAEARRLLGEVERRLDAHAPSWLFALEIRDTVRKYLREGDGRG